MFGGVSAPPTPLSLSVDGDGYESGRNIVIPLHVKGRREAQSVVFTFSESVSVKEYEI